MQYKILVLLFLLATSFTLIQQKSPVEKIRENLVLNYTTDEFITTDFDAKYFPDTTIKIKRADIFYTVKNNYGSGLLAKWYATSAISSVSKEEYADYTKEFKKVFGKTILLPGVTMKYKYEDGTHEKFPFYSADAIKTAFDKLYIKPTNTIQGYTYQRLYNLSFKEYGRDFTKFMSHIMSKKELWLSVCNRYSKDAQTKEDFYWSTYAKEFISKAFPTDEAKAKYPAFSESISKSDIGALMRRQCDGTLPTMLNCLKTILKDYDPEALQFVKGF